jgi:hypothetical protein
MKWIGIVFCICLSPVGALAQEAGKVPIILKPERFDQWSEVRQTDENVRLEKIAQQAKQWPLSIIHLVIHAGQTACVGEAKARGVRARNYLVRRGISSNRIVLVDAGWRKEVSVQVWIWPPELGKPEVVPDELDLKPDAVKLEKNCKLKYRGVIASLAHAHSPSKQQTVEQFAEALSDAYTAQTLGKLDARQPYFRTVRIVIEHSLADDNDPDRFETKDFKTLAQAQRWLKGRETPDGFPFPGSRPVRECKKGVCIYDIVAAINHKHLYLDKLSYGYRSGRFYPRTIYLLDGD